MVEVFKTNVTDRYNASLLIDQIHQNFTCYRANFDLEDCDRILRVKCISGSVNPSHLIDLLRSYGFDAEVLPEAIPVLDSSL